MAIDKVGSVGPATQSPAAETAKEKFGKVLEGAKKGQGDQAAQQAHRPSETQPRQVADTQRAESVQRAKPGCVEKRPGVSEVRPQQRVDGAADAKAAQAAKVLDQVTAAQKRLDSILEMAQTGKNFTPAELLSMQAHVHRASQELDLAGKVVEKATGGVKQILQTQV